MYESSFHRESVVSVFFVFCGFFYIFIDWMYCDRWGPKIPGCLSVCVCVCLCVCLFALERRNYRANFNKTFQKGSLVGLYVCVFTFSHLHWLNLLWSWGSENTGVSVCVSVCLCVCLSVRARTAKLLGQFQWNFPNMTPSRFICVLLSFGSLTYIMTSRLPYWTKKRAHCHGHSFHPIFWKFEI